ncbi:MAG: hypothetical protein RR320_05890 [Oscillospiraceae bacterium]
MRNFLMRVQNGLQQMMVGRYGVDALNWTLFWAYLILSIFFMRSRSLAVELLTLLLIVLYMYRMLSRNIERRAAENRFFLAKSEPIRRWFRQMKTQLTDREHRYYSCPGCHTIVRVPKGRGKIRISCPHCGGSFVKKT